MQKMCMRKARHGSGKCKCTDTVPHRMTTRGSGGRVERTTTTSHMRDNGKPITGHRSCMGQRCRRAVGATQGTQAGTTPKPLHPSGGSHQRRDARGGWKCQILVTTTTWLPYARICVRWGGGGKNGVGQRRRPVTRWRPARVGRCPGKGKRREGRRGGRRGQTTRQLPTSRAQMHSAHHLADTTRTRTRLSSLLLR